MMWWNGDWSWAGWMVMSVTMLAFWGLIGWVVVQVAPRSDGAAKSSSQILDERFARGEIDRDEYDERSDALRHRHEVTR